MMHLLFHYIYWAKVTATMQTNSFWPCWLLSYVAQAVRSRRSGGCWVTLCLPPSCSAQAPKPSLHCFTQTSRRLRWAPRQRAPQNSPRTGPGVFHSQGFGVRADIMAAMCPARGHHPDITPLLKLRVSDLNRNLMRRRGVSEMKPPAPLSGQGIQ